MILTCPECATSYFVDDSRIPAAGRTVKCSNCGARWAAVADGAEPKAAAPAPPAAKPAAAFAPKTFVDDLIVEGPEAAPAKAPAAPPTPRREASGKVMVFGISAAVIVVVVVAAIVFRAQVVRLLPASQAAYAGVGLKVNPLGLAIEKVHADATFQGGRPVLAVTGQIRNVRDTAASAPPLRVSLLDKAGKPAAIKVARPIDAAVPAGAVRHFAIAIVDPPASVTDLEVTFEPATGAKATAPVVAKVAKPAAPAGPEVLDAKPLPPGSPDALPPQ